MADGCGSSRAEPLGEDGLVKPGQEQAQRKREPSEQEADVLADAAQDGVRNRARNKSSTSDRSGFFGFIVHPPNPKTCEGRQTYSLAAAREGVFRQTAPTGCGRSVAMSRS